MFRSTGGANGAGAAVARRIKDWVHELVAPGEDVTVLVSELACSEPGCPPVETVIAIFRTGEPPMKHTIHRPSADLTRDDVSRLVS